MKKKSASELSYIRKEQKFRHEINILYDRIRELKEELAEANNLIKDLSKTLDAYQKGFEKLSSKADMSKEDLIQFIHNEQKGIAAVDALMKLQRGFY